MKVIRFKLKRHTAYLKDTKYSDELKELLSYSSPGARFSPAYNTRDEDGKRLWDGKISMFKNNSLPVGLLIGAYEELKANGLKARIVKWKNRPEVLLSKKGFWEKSEEYGYQNDAVRAMLKSFSKGGGTVLSATGTGKTKTVAQCFSHVAGNCLFIVDQVNLLYQSQAELAEWLKEKIGIIGNGKWNPQRVTVCTIQTLSAHKDKRHFKQWIKLNPISVTAIDELHKQMARRNFTVLSRVNSQAVIGLTATLQMKKKMVRWKVYSISGPVIFEFPLKDGIEKGVLSKSVVIQINVPYERNEKLYQKLLKRVDKEGRSIPIDTYTVNVVCNKNITHKVIPELVNKALKDGHAIIILGDRISHVQSIARKLGDKSPIVLKGATSGDERSQAIRWFERGKNNLIVASRIFTKGVNIKRISFMIDAAELPNKDEAMQKLGRGARLHKDKEGTIYIDLNTSPANKKAASARRNAFKKAGLPVKVIDWSNAKDVMKTAKELLTS